MNAAIRADIATQIEEMSHADAIERGALAFFGDKYGDVVRVVSIPGVSMELCGGAHVARTGEIGTFLITREESVAAGTRRIEAITGSAAIDTLQRQRDVLHRVMSDLKASEDDLREHVSSLMSRVKSADRRNEELRVRLATQAVEEGDEGSAVSYYFLELFFNCVAHPACRKATLNIFCFA